MRRFFRRYYERDKEASKVSCCGGQAKEPSLGLLIFLSRVSHGEFSTQYVVGSVRRAKEPALGLLRELIRASCGDFSGDIASGTKRQAKDPSPGGKQRTRLWGCSEI